MVDDDYSGHLLEARRAIDELETLAALVASGHPQHLAEATARAHAALFAVREIVAWCQKQGWEVGREQSQEGREQGKASATDVQATQVPTEGA